jgi:hypothetical protein
METFNAKLFRQRLLFTADKIKLPTTLGFMQVGLDQQTSTNCKSKLWFGLDKQVSTLVLKFNILFSISSGYRQTEY